MEDPFTPGGRLRLARRRDDRFGPFLLRVAPRRQGSIRSCSPGSSSPHC